MTFDFDTVADGFLCFRVPPTDAGKSTGERPRKFNSYRMGDPSGLVYTRTPSKLVDEKEINTCGHN